MIVCDRGLDVVVPLQPVTMPGRRVVQWDKDDCEELGIVKIDLLGLGMLAAMEDPLVISAGRGKPVDLAHRRTTRLFPAIADAKREPPRDHVIPFTPWRYIKTAAVLAD